MARYEEPLRFKKTLAYLSVILVSATTIVNRDVVISCAKRLASAYVQETRTRTTRTLFDDLEERATFMTPKEIEESRHRSERLFEEYKKRHTKMVQGDRRDSRLY